MKKQENALDYRRKSGSWSRGVVVSWFVLDRLKSRNANTWPSLRGMDQIRGMDQNSAAWIKLICDKCTMHASFRF